MTVEKNSKNKKKMAVVCHDAGGAEVISAYIKGHPYAYEYISFVGGPAVSIFERKKIKAIQVSDDNQQWIYDFFKREEADFLLTNIGWSVTMELGALRTAKKRGIGTIVYLDHWVNYRERFGYPKQGWERELPDEMWVGDTYGLKLAKKFFPNTKVRLEPNLYFEEIKKEYGAYITKNKKNIREKILLFISEPKSETSKTFNNTNHAILNEYDILDSFLNALSKKKFDKKILIRFHPSEKPDKYDEVIVKYQEKLKVEKSFGRSIYEDLSVSYMVVGMESMALVIALLCEKKVVSFLPDTTITSSLPFSDIILARDAKGLMTLIA